MIRLLLKDFWIALAGAFRIEFIGKLLIFFMAAPIRMAARDHAGQGEEIICNRFADGLNRDTGIRFLQILHVYLGHQLPHLH